MYARSYSIIMTTTTLNIFLSNYSLLLLSIFCTVQVQAFQLQPPHSLTRKIASVQLESSVNPDIYYWDSAANIDMKHARECADNIGECTVAEMQDMQEALKVERIQHGALGLILDVEEELVHRQLENDLDNQLALLNNAINMNSLGAEEIYSVAVASPDNHHHDQSLKGEELFLIPNVLSETVVYGIALLIIATSAYFAPSSL